MGKATDEMPHILGTSVMSQWQGSKNSYSYFGQVKPNLVKYILIYELKIEGWEYHGYKGR
jgi:hypothetical protein